MKILSVEVILGHGKYGLGGGLGVTYGMLHLPF
jgi:hypothetical protein